MIPVTRWFIKAGLVSLVLAMGVLFLDSSPRIPVRVPLLPVYWHLIAIGWITQVIMGVSIWMFPRDREQRKRLMESGGKGEVRPWIIFWALNSGLMLRLFAEPFADPSRPLSWSGGIIVISVILQMGAAFLYVAEIWPRVRERRPAPGKGARMG